MVMAFLISPGASLFLGLIVFAVIIVVSRARSGDRSKPAATTSAASSERSRLLRRLALAAPWVVVAPFLVTQVLPYVYLLLRYTAPPLAESLRGSLDESYLFWVLTGSLVAAILCAAVTLVALSRERVEIEEPVMPIARRSWTSFSRPRDAAVAVAALALLVLTCLVAGAASSPNENGWFTRLEIRNGNLAEGSSTFFGWAFSVPTLVSIAALALLTWATLRISAARPFVRPATVSAESELRRHTAALLVRLFTATALLTLGGAWLLIGIAGSGYTGVGIPGVGDFEFTSGYASFAPAFIVGGVALQTTAIVLLLLVIRGRLRPRANTTALADAPTRVAVTS